VDPGADPPGTGANPGTPAGGGKKGSRKQPGQQQGNKNQKVDPEYKEKLAENYAQVKEIFDTAEAKFKEQNYREAASFYRSVKLASVAKAQPLVDAAQKRLLEIEGLAQQHLTAADDADLARDYNKEVEELGIVLRDFPLTKACETAQSRMTALRSRREVAAYVDLAQAEAAEAAGNLLQALKLYRSLAGNPRYESSLPALKARRKVEALQKDEATRDSLKAQVQAEADKEGPVLLSTGRNYLLNQRLEQAKERFKTVLDKFPGTKYAEEAQQELAKLP
jgi:hypothetical protein